MRLPAALLLLLVVALPAAAEDEAPAPLPRLGELNPHVLAIIRTYPTDGTHRYHWPKTGSWAGVTRTLTYEGEVVCEGDPEGRCFCCGLTFEVFLRAWERWCAAGDRPFVIGGLDADGVRRLQREWFGGPEDRSTLHTALTKNGLGVRITNWNEARAGDFVQLWRHSGSGHSVVFRAWVRASEEPDAPITGMRYWSTQGSTDGISDNTEFFGDEGSTLKRDELWICRVGDPESR